MGIIFLLIFSTSKIYIIGVFSQLFNYFRQNIYEINYSENYFTLPTIQIIHSLKVYDNHIIFLKIN